MGEEKALVDYHTSREENIRGIVKECSGTGREEPTTNW